MPFKQPSFEQPDLAPRKEEQKEIKQQEKTLTEKSEKLEGEQGDREEKKEKFDVEKGKQEYADVRLSLMKSEAEYNRLDEEWSEAVDALIANPKDPEAKIRFWKIAEQLDKIKEQGKEFGDRQSELFDKLLEGKNGAQNFEAAEEAFDKRHLEFIKENPELAKYVAPETMRASEKRLKKLIEIQQKLSELQKKVEEFNKRYIPLKQEYEKLFTEGRALFESSKEKGIKEKELKENADKRKKVRNEMKLMWDEQDKLDAELKKLGAEIRLLGVLP